MHRGANQRAESKQRTDSAQPRRLTSVIFARFRLQPRGHVRRRSTDARGFRYPRSPLGPGDKQGKSIDGMWVWVCVGVSLRVCVSDCGCTYMATSCQSSGDDLFRHGEEAARASWRQLAPLKHNDRPGAMTGKDVKRAGRSRSRRQHPTALLTAEREVSRPFTKSRSAQLFFFSLSQ